MNTFKTLFQQQKRLIFLFLLTIVIPSLVLSISGILAIRNERYRNEQQILEKQQNAMTLLKNQFSGQIKNLLALLQNTARLPAFHDNDYTAIRQHLNPILNGSEPVDQLFILFKERDPFFPLLHYAPDTLKYSETVLTPEQEALLARGMKAEFESNDYAAAVLIYTELAERTSEYNTKAQMMNNLARCQKKNRFTAAAANTYTKIIKQFPASFTNTRLPLVLTSEIQLIDCERTSGNKKQALERALNLYDRILDGVWNLNENQFSMYSEMSEETINELFNKATAGKDSSHLQMRYEALKEKYLLRIEQWKDRRLIEAEIIPALMERSQQFTTEPFHLSRSIQGKDYLITAIPVSGLVCIKWNWSRMIDDWLQPAAENLFKNEQLHIIITDLAGQILVGDKNYDTKQISITGDFESYFPPWKIHIVRSELDAAGINLFRSYYFWSILTVLVILIFGTLLIIRTIVRDREVMSIKSDFVASVSHELKTPLTSIRALTERLLAGKVKDSEKMHQYFSLIDQDANKLMHLVKNILDFSKIEAGKKEYNFETTDMTIWLNETIDDFCKDHINEQIEINKHFDANIPCVSVDGDALTQCLNNLLDNAMKFSPDSKQVSVFLKKESKYIVIQVKDKGIGIPGDDLKRIFDKFYQGTAAIRQSVKGTGLGLALVKHTVEAHGGGVEVESLPGQGSTFSLFLPVANQKP